jgi:GntR family transcriptional regulator
MFANKGLMTLDKSLGVAQTHPQQPALVLDTSSFVPYYEQIAEQVRRLIKENNLKPGQTFYSEAALARQLRVSKMPVRQAFHKLRAEGLLVTQRGKTPVIGGGTLPWNFKELHGFSEEMRRRGLVPAAKLLSFEVQHPDPDTASALSVHPSELVYRMKRLRFVDQEPVAVVTSYLPERIFQGLDKQDLEGQSLYYIFEQIYGRALLRSEQIIGAVNAGHEEAQILQIRVGAALLVIRETAFDVQETPLEYAVSLLRGDRYTASVVSARKR